jgi:hypothetical protein
MDAHHRRGLLAVTTVSASRRAATVNLDHLRFLTEPITVDGQDMAVVHIYSGSRNRWVDAADGLSAVDDVARAAVSTCGSMSAGDPELLDLARKCLNFVMYMQADDGEFYNFVLDRQATINTTGRTSYRVLAGGRCAACGRSVKACVCSTRLIGLCRQLAAAYLHRAGAGRYAGQLRADDRTARL